ncbi:hypothetical protein DICPUDRAFT_10349, partial [Dictyostelium purpureum]
IIKRDNEMLFFLVWRNVFIYCEIKRHMDLFKKYNRVKIEKEEHLLHHPYREYISTVYYNFDAPISNYIIPKSVIKIEFSEKFKREISPGNLIGTNVKELTLSLDGFKDCLCGIIPASVTSLELRDYNKEFEKYAIPPSVKELFLWDYNEQIQDENNEILPESINTLGLGRYTHPLLELPRSITSLSISLPYNKQLPALEIPANICTLKLREFKSPLRANDLPPTVTELDVGDHYNHPILANSIPLSIRKITFGLLFEQQIHINTIPPSVQILSFRNKKMKSLVSKN